jgi:predicted Zn-dependent protease
MDQAQKELSVQSTSVRERQQRIDKAVKTLESALVWDKWQPFIGGEIHAQIGMVQYMVKDYLQAEPHLRKASPRNGLAQGLLGALHFQRKEYPEMERAFEGAVKGQKKEGILWAVYAWCLLQHKDRDKALKVMNRGVAANPSDEKLKAGLVALQNDKTMGGGRQVRFQRH